MNQAIAESHRIQPHHLERAAYVYVRQSSLRQVAEHRESQRRQYERVDWAIASGWPHERPVDVGQRRCYPTVVRFNTSDGWL